MKQKNMILIAVAVGCGLVAAVLTSQMSAKPKVEDNVEIPVAAKELAVGTKLGKDDLQKYIEYKKYPKDALPEKYAATPDDLADKRLTRAVRKGEPFNPADLTTNVVISPPPGFNVMTFPTSSAEAVAGFAIPGSRVDIIASVKLRSKRNVEMVFPLFIDMLVLAIDTNSGGPQNTGAFASVGMVSVAVTPEQGLLLQGALSRGAQLRMMLRNTEKAPTWKYIPTEKEIWAIFADNPASNTGTGDSNDPEETPETKDKGKMHVAVENLPAGTQLTPEVIDTKFKLVDFTPPAPANAIVNLREHVNRYLQKDLAANQFVPTTYVADTNIELPKPKVEPKPEPKAAPMVDSSPTPKPEPTLPSAGNAPKPDAKKPVYYDATIQTANGVTKYRYQKLDNGEYKFLGILKDDGTVVPAPGSAQPEPKPAAEEQKSPEAKPGSGPISA